MTPTASDAALLDRVDAFLRDEGLDPSTTVVTVLTGDASDRRYVRVAPTSGPSLVLMVHVEAIDTQRLPFVQVHTLLTAMGLPVPAVRAASGPLGILALDDLGDATLQHALDGADGATRLALYREAVHLIVALQQRAPQHAAHAALPFSLAFDVEKLTWELAFFTRHFLEAFRGATLSPAVRAALDDEWRQLASALAAEPRVLCHRDFHSRNLMWHGGRLHLIDFQDARLGPDTYDLVSLVRDSYVSLTAAERTSLIDDTARALGHTDLAHYRSRADTMALQRNLKALGTFGFQATSRGNAAYAQYVPRTLEYIRETTAAHPRFERLRALLAESLDELR